MNFCIKQKKRFIALFLIFSAIYIENFYTKNNHIEKNIMNANFFILNNTLENKEKYNNNCCGVIIIGGGPAGLAAATYCSRLGIPSTTLILGPNPGGELMKTGIVENWPGIVAMEGKTIMENTITQAQKSGAHIIYEYVKEIVFSEWPFKVITNLNTYYGFSIMLATGSMINKLNCPGEEKYWGKGVSSCAICDAPIHKDKTVIVVGGGDSACEEVLQLLPHVNMIYVLVRGDAMRASHAMQEKIKNNPKIKILYNTEIQEIIGNEESITDAFLRKKDGTIIKFSEINKGATFSGIFIAIGHYPNTKLVDNIVEKENNGLIKTIEISQKTSFAGLFCGGDVSNPYRQAGIASGDGAAAAIDIFNFLVEKNINFEMQKKFEHIWLTKNKNNISCENGICTLPNSNKLQAPEIIQKHNKNKNMIDITSEKAYKEIEKNEKDSFYIIDFYGTYCPACVSMKKTLSQYIKKNNHLSVYLINIENIQNLSSLYNIKSIPTILLMKNNKVISKKIGYMNIDELEHWINKNIK